MKLVVFCQIFDPVPRFFLKTFRPSDIGDLKKKKYNPLKQKIDKIYLFSLSVFFFNEGHVMLLQRTVTLKWELRGRRVVNLREVSYCNYLTRNICVFWADSRLLEVVKIQSWSHMEVGQCRLFFGWGVGSPLERKIIRLSPSQLEPMKLKNFNFNLRSGISCSTRPTCRTKRTQEFVTHKYTQWLVQLYFLVFIGFIVLYFSIICFVNSSVIQPFCILLQ